MKCYKILVVLTILLFFFPLFSSAGYINNYEENKYETIEKTVQTIVGKQNINEKFKGIAIGSYFINNSTMPQLYQFINECHINNIIIDFGWITWAWDNTDFDKVCEFIDEIQQDSITVWLMYRARTLPGDGHHIPHQVHRSGIHDRREIRFTHQKSRDWALSWTDKLIEKYPSIDGMIMYNPRFLQDCCYSVSSNLKFMIETGIIGFPRFFMYGTNNFETWLNWKCEEIREFIAEWNNYIKNQYPQIKTGSVVLSESKGAHLMAQNLTQLDDHVDILFPFVALNNVQNPNIAGDMLNETKRNVSCYVISDIKIYGPYENTDTDIVNAIKSSVRSNGDGFFIWDYDSLDSTKYNITKIINAYNRIYD